MLWRKLVENKNVQHVKRHWLTISFFLGFLMDNLTLNRVDQVFDNAVLAFYVFLAMFSLALLYAGSADRLPEKWSNFMRKYAPLAVQYSFGGLLSGMLIFYGRSGSLFVSWPVMLMFVGVIYMNETVRDRVSRLIYNIAILFIGLFSYVVLVIPVFTGHMGPWVYIGSGLLALTIMWMFIQVLYRIVPRFLEIQMRKVVFTIGIIYVVFNTLYFTNIIPPIPLSLKDVGIYHSVVHFEDIGQYQLKYETGNWWYFWKDSDKVFHALPGDNIFCFARVFAPTRLKTDIYHSWEYHDPETGKWVEHYRLSYAISGGRNDGFRGYTLIQNYTPGTWRCRVETERGQVLGTETFTVDSEGEPGALVTRIE